jgi:SAM-dependent methyltransferase
MIDWHARYLQQASWTRPLRDYLFERCGLDRAGRILEVGCGTGAVLEELEQRFFSTHGIDRDPARLAQAREHAARARLVCGDALALPYAAGVFDATLCHFLLLWVSNPPQALREMRRVTRPGGFVLALAEPDYLSRVDRPPALIPLGRWQTDSLRRQGADPGVGARLAAMFRQAGLTVLESGPLRVGVAPVGGDRMEWAVLEHDLQGRIPQAEFERLRSIDRQARAHGNRILQVPTYFAVGQVPGA